MTPLQETVLGNGNLHTHLKILFIRRKLFHIFGGLRRSTKGNISTEIGQALLPNVLEQKYRIITEALGIWAALPVGNERQ